MPPSMPLLPGFRKMRPCCLLDSRQNSAVYGKTIWPLRTPDQFLNTPEPATAPHKSNGCAVECVVIFLDVSYNDIVNVFLDKSLCTPCSLGIVIFRKAASAIRTSGELEVE
jgi:hypothetical protein